MTDTSGNYVQRFNEEVERRLLYVLLHESNRSFPIALDLIKHDGSEFYGAGHAQIFKAAFDLWDAHKLNDGLDGALFLDELRQRGEIQKLSHVLLGVVTSTGDPLEVEGYCRVVTRDAQLREAGLYASSLTGAVLSGRLDEVARLTEKYVNETTAPGVGSDPPGQSWQPSDLSLILSGNRPKIEPSVGLGRSDGLRLIYPGKEHSALGEMESGKSWFAAGSCAVELLKGNHVLYIHFEESDATDTVERIRDLGVPAWKILELFHFVGPLEPVRPRYLASLLDPAPSLVILDGVNEAMALHGQGIRDEDGAAAFRRVLVKPCTSVGAAVLACDHVVKDREARGRYGLGSIHKGNGINGSLIMLENAEPFGRGQRGRSNVFVTKDRPGQLRGQGKPTKMAGKTFMGSLVVDDTRMQHPHLDLTFWAPAMDEVGPEERSQGDQDDAYILKLVTALVAEGHSANVRAVRSKSSISNPRTDDALTRLTLDQKLAENPGPKNSRIFTPAESLSPKATP